MARFFYIPKNKKFNFSTRYYDEQKEDLDKRVEKIKREMGVADDDPNKLYASTIRKGEMRGYLKKAGKRDKQSTGRLFIILIVLFLIVYFLLFF